MEMWDTGKGAEEEGRGLGRGEEEESCPTEALCSLHLLRVRAFVFVSYT